MSLLLLDGASMWFRSYFGVPSSIKAPDGRPVNALRGFLDAVATLITRERPSRLVVCRDVEPELREVRPGHFAACHLYSERAAAPVVGAAAGSASSLA